MILARNFATIHQDEVKSIAFSKHQIKIHQVPMYFIDVEANNTMQELLSSHQMTLLMTPMLFLPLEKQLFGI